MPVLEVLGSDIVVLLPISSVLLRLVVKLMIADVVASVVKLLSNCEMLLVLKLELVVSSEEPTLGIWIVLVDRVRLVGNVVSASSRLVLIEMLVEEMLVLVTVILELVVARISVALESSLVIELRIEDRRDVASTLVVIELSELILVGILSDVVASVGRVVVGCNSVVDRPDKLDCEVVVIKDSVVRLVGNIVLRLCIVDTSIVVEAALDKLVESNNELTNELMIEVKSVDTGSGDEVMSDEVVSVGSVNSLDIEGSDIVVMASRLDSILVKLLARASLVVSTGLEN